MPGRHSGSVTRRNTRQGAAPSDAAARGNRGSNARNAATSGSTMKGSRMCTIASTTDTNSGKERKTADFTALESNKYECDQINFDFYIRYKTLDLWARYQDFQLRIRNAIIKRQSLDFIMAGFNGVKRAETSDRSSNPMLAVQ